MSVEPEDMRFACPHCDKHLAAPPELAGKVIKCPDCNQSFTVPKPAPVSAPVVQPPKPEPLVEQSNIEFECPSCHEPLASPPDMAGTENQCPACNHTFTVPRPASGVSPIRIVRTKTSAPPKAAAPTPSTVPQAVASRPKKKAPVLMIAVVAVLVLAAVIAIATVLLRRGRSSRAEDDTAGSPKGMEKQSAIVPTKKPEPVAQNKQRQNENADNSTKPKSVDELATKVEPSQSQPSLDGWGRTRWGMTIPEVKAAIGNDVELKEATPDKLEYFGIEIAGERFFASCYFSGVTHRLEKVELARSFAENENGKGIYEGVIELLTTKYGKPLSSVRGWEDQFRVTFKQKSIWAIGNTKIEAGASIWMGYLVELIYTPAETGTGNL